MSRYKPCGAENCQLTKDKERIAELEAERDRWKAAFNSERASCVSVQAERDKLREHVELLEEDIRCYQADL